MIPRPRSGKTGWTVVYFGRRAGCQRIAILSKSPRSLWPALVLLAVCLFGLSVQARQPGETFRDCPDCPEMVALPAGQFVMGSPLSEHGRFDQEGPQHPVSVKAFAMGRTDVTMRQFRVFATATSYQPDPCVWPQGATWQSLGFQLEAPVVCVSWKDAHAYAVWLNGRIGAKDPQSGPYRLPSEAEWEYAARAGTTTARWWGEAIGSGKANCNGCGSPWDNRELAPVGSFPANSFGLADMLGNVWEWTEDCWNESYAGAPTDGRAWTTGDCSHRVLRGGSWSNLAKFVRSAARSRGPAPGESGDYASYAGFRLVRSLP